MSKCRRMGLWSEISEERVLCALYTRQDLTKERWRLAIQM